MTSWSQNQRRSCMLVVYKLRCTNGDILTYDACARGKHVSPGALPCFICTIASMVALLQTNIRPRVLCSQGLRAAIEVQGTRGERAAVVNTGIPGKRIAYAVPPVTYWHTLRLHAASTYVLECLSFRFHYNFHNSPTPGHHTPITAAVIYPATV